MVGVFLEADTFAVAFDQAQGWLHYNAKNAAFYTKMLSNLALQNI